MMATLRGRSTASTGPSFRRRKKSIAPALCAKSSAGFGSRRLRPAGGSPQGFVSTRALGKRRELRDAQSEGVPKVTEVHRPCFCHFWHPLTLGFSKQIGADNAFSYKDELSKLL